MLAKGWVSELEADLSMEELHAAAKHSDDVKTGLLVMVSMAAIVLTCIGLYLHAGA